MKEFYTVLKLLLTLTVISVVYNLRYFKKAKDTDLLQTDLTTVTGSFQSQLDEYLKDPVLREANVKECIQKWKQLLSLPDSDVLFYDMVDDVFQECRASIMGNPFQHLPQFRSPCWVVTYNEQTISWNESQHPAIKRATLVRFPQAVAEINKRASTWRLHCLPKVLLAGFTKSGTTDLHDSLTKIPSFQDNLLKEYHYWNDVRLNPSDVQAISVKVIFGSEKMTFRRYVEVLGMGTQYHYYKDTLPDFYSHIAVDSSPSYIWRWRDPTHRPDYESDSQVKEGKYTLADTLQHFIPDLRILLIMRNPIERAYSACRAFNPDCSSQWFHDAVESVIPMFNSCLRNYSIRDCVLSLNIQGRGNRYLLPSLYHVYIREWLRVFPRQQFLFIRAEDYYANRTAIVSRIVPFLGLDDLDHETYTRLNNSEILNHSDVFHKRSKLPMFNKTRDLLSGFYHTHNQELARLLENNDFLWQS